MAIKTKAFIRRAERDDLDKVVEWMEDEDFLMFLYGDPTRSPRQIREQIVTMLGRSQGSSAPSGIYLIIDSAEQGPLGMLSLQNISWRNRGCSIDLYIGKKHLRNHLLAAAMFYCSMEYCFNELNLHRVTAYIYSFNEPSWRIFERAGAKRELTLKDHIAREGKFHDVYGYGLLRREFEEFRKNSPNLTDGLMETMLDEHQKAIATAKESGQ
jgi:RimJ/RimL family protein N-acetyltransferase